MVTTPPHYLYNRKAWCEVQKNTLCEIIWYLRSKYIQSFYFIGIVMW